MGNLKKSQEKTQQIKQMKAFMKGYSNWTKVAGAIGLLVVFINAVRYYDDVNTTRLKLGIRWKDVDPSFFFQDIFLFFILFVFWVFTLYFGIKMNKPIKPKSVKIYSIIALAVNILLTKGLFPIITIIQSIKYLSKWHKVYTDFYEKHDKIEE